MNLPCAYVLIRAICQFFLPWQTNVDRDLSLVDFTVCIIYFEVKNRASCIRMRIFLTRLVLGIPPHRGDAQWLARRPWWRISPQTLTRRSKRVSGGVLPAPSSWSGNICEAKGFLWGRVRDAGLWGTPRWGAAGCSPPATSSPINWCSSTPHLSWAPGPLCSPSLSAWHAIDN